MTVFYAKVAKTVVAIPAKNEEYLIEACLGALARQSEIPDDILVLVNNSTDRTARVARGLAGRIGSRLHVEELTLPSSQANAGTARRLAMERAVDIAGNRGAILTTDADGQVPGYWVARNLAWLRSGHDAVCGMAAIDPVDEAAIPAHLIADDLAESHYTQLLDEIDHIIDPRPWDPWPRHTHRSGASIAVRSAVYAAVGGLPKVSHSEDRDFIAKLEQRDCKIRHDPCLTVIVSGRRVGRAEGGMAETIARRMMAQDIWADDRLEMPLAALRRSQLRREARAIWASHLACGFLASTLRLPFAELEVMMRSPWFGDAWAAIEATSPVLERRPVAMTQLRAAIREADPILCQLREAGGLVAEVAQTRFGDVQVWAE
jgi:GT2 family glycosyltransferase